ncbi:MAG: UDP-glucose 4-epimerase GalE [Phycisphaerae bacterium]
MNVLVTGGAGYIGSHILRALKHTGHTPVAYDSLVKGNRPAVGDAKLIEGDVTNAETLTATLKDHEIELVIHMAAFIEAGESCSRPDKYFHNNTVAGLTLLDACRDAGVRKVVFSSTAAVYGEPESVPIRETDRLAPINPYGASKLCVEYMLNSYAAAFEMGFVSLRYFNVAGADPAGDIGEDHRPETHLIPLVLQVALGKRDRFMIFGDDYDTPDGTCIRDFIHVCDLADAHLLAADAIEAGSAKAYNLGSGHGFSVKEVLQTCREVTGAEIPAEVADRRGGDPPRLVASCDKARDELGWRPRFPELRTMVEHAWNWHSSHPEGY